MVFLANPNNPTGTYVPFDEVKRLHRGLPPHVLLVLDAAYAEYVRRNDYEAGIELVATSENVVMCRTFSKIHGLPRCGSAGSMGRRMWSMRSTASADRSTSMRRRMAAGIAAIGDAAHVEASRAHNEKWLAWLQCRAPQARARGDAERREFRVDPFPDRQRPTAEEADAFLTPARADPAPRRRPTSCRTRCA